MNKLILENIAKKWFDAFNNKNIDALLRLYDDKAEHFSPKLKVKQPETNGLIKGKEALYNWWNQAFIDMPSLTYVPTYFIIDDDMLFMEYLRKVDNEADMIVGEVLCFKENKIISSKVFHQ